MHVLLIVLDKKNIFKSNKINSFIILYFNLME